jgi:peptidoglycan/xylan/chitin deacetylase (PgdA/CDA1 family)
VYLFIFFIIIAVIYTIVPFLLSRWAGFGVLKCAGKKAVAHNEIAFTFDDGPNPIYTNELLDLLKQYQIKASFFVVGSEAEKYPDIILRMHKEGHLIGIHNYVHRSNWLMTPWRVNQDLEKSANILEGITGMKPKYYRPPWGMLNLFDYFTHKDYKIILWSLMVGDWRSKGGSKKREEGILNRVKPGDIILLHDSGETWGANEDAPQYTITALKTVFKELSKRGYTYKRIDELQ